jgi:hypothetical protein
MHHRSFVSAFLTAAVTLPLAISASVVAAGDPIEWPELPYEPCFRVERVLHPTDICAQGGWAHGRAINSHGTIVGDAGCGPGASRAFVWRMNAPFQLIPTPPGTVYSWAWAINDEGWVAGHLDGGSASGNAFVWHEQTGEFHLIPSPFGSGTVSPYAINSHGVIVGTIHVTGEPGVTLLQGFQWHDGVLTRLEELHEFGGRVHIPVDINNEGTILGYFPAGDGGNTYARPFLIQGGELLEFEPFPKGWNGTVPGALLHDAVFVTESWNNPDMPNVRVAAFGDTSGHLHQVHTSELFRRMVLFSGNVFGDAVGARITMDGTTEAIVVRHGELHVLWSLVLGAPLSGSPRAISSNGHVTGGPYHIVPAPPPVGDLSRSCRRDLDDLPLLLGQWGTGHGPADLNGDGRVDLDDLLILLRLIAEDLSL